MRPVRLEMQAFGSFAQGTVDFTRLDPQLYLVAGDTGAGKTTVFDAIVFALYGEASGADRKPGMMHSDHCPKSEDTAVRLCFLQNGREYTVERRLHFTKSRATGTYEEAPKVSATLEGGELIPIEKAEAVTRKIEELTGVTADQFRKIAMLAQGEFRAFLKDEKGRGAILEKLFEDSLSLYQRYEQLLERADRVMERRRAEDQSRIAQVMEPSVFPFPEEWDAERRAQLDAHNDRLLENLEALCGAEREESRTLEAEIAEKEKQERELGGRLAQAQQINRTLDALEAARARRAELGARSDEMAALSEREQRAQLALHAVRPAEDALHAAQADCDAAQQELLGSRARTAQARERAAAAEKTAAEAEKQRPEADAQRARAEQIEKDLPVYRERSRKREQLLRAQEECAAAEEECLRLRKTQEETEEKLRQTKEKLSCLREAENEKITADRAFQAARERLERLNGSDGLASIVKLAARRRREAARETEACNAATAEANRLRTLYGSLNDAFLKAQSGIIGQRTEEKLRKTGRVKCPVCHAVYTAADPFDFAKPEPGAPTAEDLDRMEAQKKEAEQRETKRRRAMDTATAAFETLRQRAQSAAEALGLPADFDALCAGELERAAAGAAEAKAKALAARDAAERRVQDKQALEKAADSLSAAEKANRQKLDEALSRKSGAEKDAAALAAALEGMQRLSCADEAEARTVLEGARRKAEEIDGRIRSAQEEDKDAHAACQAAQAAESSAGVARDRAAEAVSRTAQAYRQALTDAGFGDEAVYRAALPPGDAGEAWLERARRKLEAYRREVSECEGALRTAEEAAKAHPERVDTAQLEAERGAKAAELEARRGDEKALVALLVQHETALRAVREAKARLAATDAVSGRLARLARLAVKSDKGSSIQNQSLRRYMTTYIFRAILEEANRHLRQLTGGQYALVHRREARKGYAQGGLLIDVEDALTGETRDTASLSGGESFLASLALALGLSSVVQRRSGVRRVDAMFIDEGFGTLSDRELDAAVETLRSIAGGSCQIGIISHVVKLEECIESQLRVSRTETGSRVELRS